MKIIDRYVLWSFIKNYAISLMVLIGMYVVLDMVFNFDELTEIRSAAVQPGEQRLLAVLTNIGSYYFYQVFLFFAQLSGIIPVVAAAFTMMRLSRFNELTAVLAAGVPLLRVAAPIIIASVVLNALLIVDQEVVIPQMIDRLARTHDEMHTGSKHFAVQAIQDETGALLYAARYFPASPQGRSPATMQDVDVLERNERLLTAAKIPAAKAEWDPRLSAWRLEGGVRLAQL